jgi:hypothetical protein
MADRNCIQSRQSETLMVWYGPCPCSLSHLFSILVIYEENGVSAKPVAGAASVRRSWCTRLCECLDTFSKARGTSSRRCSRLEQQQGILSSRFCCFCWPLVLLPPPSSRRCPRWARCFRRPTGAVVKGPRRYALRRHGDQGARAMLEIINGAIM